MPQTQTYMPTATVVREAALPTGHLEVRISPYSTCQDIDEYIGFAARDNAKRGFLFVSRVLGKHVPVTPSRMRKAHVALANSIDVSTGDSFVFVGMAETATGLGYGTFEAFQRSVPDVPALYVHTTRYWMDDDALTFEESHSHAPNLCLHVALDPRVRAQQEAANVLVLVDDELSTGRTFAHLVREYRLRYPAVEKVQVLTLCDFSGSLAADTIIDGPDVRVSIDALLMGDHIFLPSCASGHGNPQSSAQPSKHAHPNLGGGFGRRPVSTALRIDDVVGAPELISLAKLDTLRIKVVGTGEFMHGAYVLGAWLEDRGHEVHVQSTTRSPILPGYGAINNACRVSDHYGEGVPNFLYNHFPDDYELTLVCCEGPANQSTRSIASTLSARIVQFVHHSDFP